MARIIWFWERLVYYSAFLAHEAPTSGTGCAPRALQAPTRLECRPQRVYGVRVPAIPRQGPVHAGIVHPPAISIWGIIRACLAGRATIQQGATRSARNAMSGLSLPAIHQFAHAVSQVLSRVQMPAFLVICANPQPFHRLKDPALAHSAQLEPSPTRADSGYARHARMEHIRHRGPSRYAYSEKTSQILARFFFSLYPLLLTL